MSYLKVLLIMLFALVLIGCQTSTNENTSWYVTVSPEDVEYSNSEIKNSIKDINVFNDKRYEQKLPLAVRNRHYISKNGVPAKSKEIEFIFDWGIDQGAARWLHELFDRTRKPERGSYEFEHIVRFISLYADNVHLDPLTDSHRKIFTDSSRTYIQQDIESAFQLVIKRGIQAECHSLGGFLRRYSSLYTRITVSFILADSDLQ